MSKLTTLKSAGFTQIASALSAGEFQSFEAVQAQVKTAKFYESEELWVINVEYLGEYYTLRPDTQTLPLNSTAQDLLNTVQSLLTQINKRKPTASPEVKAIQQQVFNKRAIDFAEKRTGLQLDLLIKTKEPYSPGQLVYSIYNGYIDQSDFENGYVNLDRLELLTSFDAADISTDELNPTSQVINKQFADGAVITFIATEVFPEKANLIHNDISDADLAKAEADGSNALRVEGDFSNLQRVEGDFSNLQGPESLTNTSVTYAAYVELAPSKQDATKLVPATSSNPKLVNVLYDRFTVLTLPNLDKISTNFALASN